MMKAEAKIGFLKEYREHPEKYLPLIDHAWKCFGTIRNTTLDGTPG